VAGPDKLQSRNLTAGDVSASCAEQNVQVRPGRSPTARPHGPGLPVHPQHPRPAGRGEQFANIVLKTGTDGESPTSGRQPDELGAQRQDTVARLDGKPSSGLGIFSSQARTPWTR